MNKGLASKLQKQTSHRIAEGQSSNQAMASGGDGQVPGASLMALQRAAGNWAVTVAVESRDDSVPQEVRAVLSRSGQPLDPATRAFMESRFQHDFSQVRVHTDPQATTSARAIAAKAYTVGDDIVFSPNRYDPSGPEGRRLLAHELAHTVQQQRGGEAPALQPDSPTEQGARRASTEAVNGTLSGAPVQVSGSSAPGIARDTDEQERRAFWPNARPRLTPLPGHGAGDLEFDFNRMAAGQVDIESVRAEPMGVGDRRTSQYQVDTSADAIVRQSKFLSDLGGLLRRGVYSSHAAMNAREVKGLIDAVVAKYERLHPGVDSDAVWLIAHDVQMEYDAKQLHAQRQRVGEVARQLEADPILRSHLEWQKQVEDLANESGLDRQYVEEFLLEYNQLNGRRFAGTIDPRSIPFVQAEVPLYEIAYILKNYTPVGTPFQLYESFTGQDILTGERLPMWERVLNVVLILFPSVVAVPFKLIGRAAKTIAKVAVEVGATARKILRFAGKLKGLPIDKVRMFIERIREARNGAKAMLQLTREEKMLGQQVNEAMKELGPGVEADIIPIDRARKLRDVNAPAAQPKSPPRVSPTTTPPPTTRSPANVVRPGVEADIIPIDRARKLRNVNAPAAQPKSPPRVSPTTTPPPTTQSPANVVPIRRPPPTTASGTALASRSSAFDGNAARKLEPHLAPELPDVAPPVADPVTTPKPDVPEPAVVAKPATNARTGTNTQLTPAPLANPDVADQAAESKRKSKREYPLIWPVSLHPPTTSNFRRVKGAPRDTNLMYQERLARVYNRGAREPIDPKKVHIHHRTPLFLGGKDDPSLSGNGIILPARQHLKGHVALRYQPQMAAPPNGLPPMNVDINKHPDGTRYYLAGYKEVAREADKNKPEPETEEETEESDD